MSKTYAFVKGRSGVTLFCVCECVCDTSAKFLGMLFENIGFLENVCILRVGCWGGGGFIEALFACGQLMSACACVPQVFV